MVLVNGIEAWLDVDGQTIPLTSQAYLPDVIHPDGTSRIARFAIDPWPTWVLTLPDGRRIEQALFVAPGRAAVMLSWRLLDGGEGTLAVRPLLSGRDYHALHHENPAFRFDAAPAADRVAWHPYPDVPAVVAQASGTYAHAPEWYRQFLYAEERARGLDDREDLASPGMFRFALEAGEATLVLAAEGHEPREPFAVVRAVEAARRGRFAAPMTR